MIAYRNERIENAMLYFAKEHYKKTKKSLSQTALYKYLAFFEFRMLEKRGEMPFDLQYRAMEHGPVPIEIYDERANPGAFKKIVFEPYQTQKGATSYLVKAKGTFETDYFSENELDEMKNLIEIFAQQWIGAAVMSDASHQAIRAWKKTYGAARNSVIDPISNFSRNITELPIDDLTPAEERYLLTRRIAEAAK
jgi:uncharacterized phage-associated protein